MNKFPHRLSLQELQNEGSRRYGSAVDKTEFENAIKCSCDHSQGLHAADQLQNCIVEDCACDAYRAKNETGFRCPICLMETLDKPELEEHMLSAHERKNSDRDGVCDYCEGYGKSRDGGGPLETCRYCHGTGKKTPFTPNNSNTDDDIDSDLLGLQEEPKR